jgi:hypothetical protein
VNRLLIFTTLVTIIIVTSFSALPQSANALTLTTLAFASSGTDLAGNCSKLELNLTMSMTGTDAEGIGPGGEIIDWYGIIFLNGDGNPISAGFGIMEVGITYTGTFPIRTFFTPTGSDQLPLTLRPITIQIYDTPSNNPSSVLQERVNFITNSTFLASATTDPAIYIPSCANLPLFTTSPAPSTDLAIDQEQAVGIERVFDDGIVVAHQPNGDYHFYLGDGCLIGTISKSFLDSANTNQWQTLASIEGCDGYLVNVDATGYPSCAVVLNMYGPGGYNKTHWLEEQFDSTLACKAIVPRCSVQVQDGCITGGTVPSQADVIFINGINNSVIDHLNSASLVDQATGDKTLGIYNDWLTDIGSVENSAPTDTLVLLLTSTDQAITLIGHSQGAAIIAEALRRVAVTNPDRLNNLTVYTFGSPVRFWPQNPEYRHCGFDNDPIVNRGVSPFREIPTHPLDFYTHSFSEYMDYFYYCTE